VGFIVVESVGLSHFNTEGSGLHDLLEGFAVGPVKPVLEFLFSTGLNLYIGSRHFALNSLIRIFNGVSLCRCTFELHLPVELAS
jgi:hypothetical protein